MNYELIHRLLSPSSSSHGRRDPTLQVCYRVNYALIHRLPPPPSQEEDLAFRAWFRRGHALGSPLFEETAASPAAHTLLNDLVGSAVASMTVAAPAPAHDRRLTAA